MFQREPRFPLNPSLKGNQCFPLDPLLKREPRPPLDPSLKGNQCPPLDPSLKFFQWGFKRVYPFKWGFKGVYPFSQKVYK